MRDRIMVVVAVTCMLTAPLFADEAAGWRTDGTGRYPDAEPATRWSASDNVIWKTALASWTNSSPIVVGDRLFTCGEPDVLFCIDTKNGRVLWDRRCPREDVLTDAERIEAARLNQERQEYVKTTAEPLRKKIAEVAQILKNLQARRKETPDDAGLKQRVSETNATRLELDKQQEAIDVKLRELSRFALPHKSDIGGYSSPTPVSDGKFIYVLFGTGMAACYDLQGERKWCRFVGHPENQYGHSASPVLLDGVLFVHVDDMMALKKEAGEVIWSKPLPAGFGSPVAGRIGREDFLFLAKGLAVRAKDGEALKWRCPALEFASAVVCDGVAYYIQNGGGAFRLSTDDSAVIEPLWKTSPKKQRYYASPVVHDGLVYTVTEQGNLSIIDAKNGSVVNATPLDLGETVFSSVTLAGGYLFITGEKGATVVFRPGREFKEVARNTLEPLRSTPVFVGKRMYVRTLKAVYCIGEK